MKYLPLLFACTSALRNGAQGFKWSSFSRCNVRVLGKITAANRAPIASLSIFIRRRRRRLIAVSSLSGERMRSKRNRSPRLCQARRERTNHASREPSIQDDSKSAGS